MTRVSGTLEDAYGALTVAQFTEARRDLFAALGLDYGSRTAFLNYLNGKTMLKMQQIEDCKKVFAKYGIQWTLKI